jgi:hypothetical protein
VGIDLFTPAGEHIARSVVRPHGRGRIGAARALAAPGIIGRDALPLGSGDPVDAEDLAEPMDPGSEHPPQGRGLADLA